MASRILNPQRREVVVRGDGNCFYRAITLWNDEISDEKHEEIRVILGVKTSQLTSRNDRRQSVVNQWIIRSMDQ